MNRLVDLAYIHRLALSEEKWDRWNAANLLKNYFSTFQDRDLASQYIHDLSKDTDEEVRWIIAVSLGKLAPLIFDKIIAWEDLIRLTSDDYPKVKLAASESLVPLSQEILDKKLLRQDLAELKKCDENYVRMYANFCLAKISIFMASEAKDLNNLKSALENAIEFFKSSSEEIPYFNPADFCLPFYRIYFSLVFEKENEPEFKRYLMEAEQAVKGSKSKEALLETLKNLTRALQISQEFDDKKIGVSEWYCNKATESLAKAQEKTPSSVKLIEKGIPIIIKSIETKARQICQITRGRDIDDRDLGAEIWKEAKLLSSSDANKAQQSVIRIASKLEIFSKRLPIDQRTLPLEVIEEIKHATDFIDKLEKIELTLLYVLSAMEEDRNDKVEIVLNVLKIKMHQDQLFKDLLSRLEAVIFELEQRSLNDPALKRDVSEAAKYIRAVELDVEHRLEYTIPLIPVLLNYKGVIKLESGINLQNVWNKVSGIRI